MRFQRLMPHLAGKSARTEKEFIVRDNATADAGADRHINHVRESAPSTVAMLAERGEISIIPHERGYVKFIFETRFQWKIDHAPQIGGGVNDAAPWIEWARRTDANASHARPIVYDMAERQHDAR